jgi:hypothetical protein
VVGRVLFEQCAKSYSLDWRLVIVRMSSVESKSLSICERIILVYILLLLLILQLKAK